MTFEPRAARCRALALFAAAALVTSAASAAAQEESTLEPTPPPRASRNELPIAAYTYRAAGIDGLTFGAQGYGTMLAAGGQEVLGGGGVTVYGSPVERLTLIADLPRAQASGEFAPSFAILGRPYGENARGFAFGMLAKYKVEGFGFEEDEAQRPPGEAEGEVEHEVEGGLLVGFADEGWHLDLNGITGVGLNEEGEVDVEGRMRVGYDLGEYVRLGIDAQLRGRVHGEKGLPGGRTWDFAAGPQVLVGVSHFVASLTAGPATIGVAEGIGFTAVAGAGGTTL